LTSVIGPLSGCIYFHKKLLWQKKEMSTATVCNNVIYAYEWILKDMLTIKMLAYFHRNIVLLRLNYHFSFPRIPLTKCKQGKLWKRNLLMRMCSENILNHVK